MECLKKQTYKTHIVLHMECLTKQTYMTHTKYRSPRNVWSMNHCPTKAYYH